MSDIDSEIPAGMPDAGKVASDSVGVASLQWVNENLHKRIRELEAGLRECRAFAERGVDARYSVEHCECAKLIGGKILAVMRRLMVRP